MKKALYIFCTVLLVIGCARMGNPDGGWYDDTPPRVVGATPADQATNVKAQKVTILFNEFIKLEDAQNKVIVSPPQMEQPDIKAAGKKIIVELKDSLRDSTTYTIDFSDAISDNNEGNPMGAYTFSFSTGDHIDTLELSGYVLNAADLEPVKGVLVGLYQCDKDSVLPDSTFRTQPMMRVSRTDSRGRFVIKGVAPADYRVFALQDADGDFLYSQKSELVGYDSTSYYPSSKPDTRQDTIWRDTLHIETILKVPYTHFLPDDITLLAFQAPQTDRYLLKAERKDPERIDFYFTYGDSLLPQIQGLNFDATDAFVVEASEHRDTVSYWLRDTALVNRDTLQVEVRYQVTDSTGVLVEQTDTLDVLPKVSFEKRQKEQQKELEKWQKEQEKKKRRDEPYDSIYPQKALELKFSVSGSMAPDQTLLMTVPAPLEQLDTSFIHLYSKIDTLWYRAPFIFEQTKVRQYRLLAEWRPGVEYSLEIDSAAFSTIYGLASAPVKQGIKVQENDEFSTLFVGVSGLSGTADSCIVVELLSASDEPVKRTRVEKGVASFYYIAPGKYYLRAFVDSNGNGRWDTGDLDSGLQAENVYYYHEELELKAKWDVTEQWNLTARRRFEQKPTAITKQKPDQAKKLQDRNAQRAKQLGIEYLKDKTGVSL